MNKTKHRFLPFLLLFFVLLQNSEARVVSSMSYEELTKKADVIVIIEPIKNESCSDKYTGQLYGHASGDFAGINTTFKVYAVLKSLVKVEEPFVVLHFISKKVIPYNGPNFARFFPGPLQFEKKVLKGKNEIGGITSYQEAPMWIAFLKKRDDGRYEPITEPYDSAYSFKELHEPSFFVIP
ncbi:MAG: hypothetical protein ABIP97_05445 [Chthoniobacterales bacterium]